MASSLLEKQFCHCIVKIKCVMDGGFEQTAATCPGKSVPSAVNLKHVFYEHFPILVLKLA